jgi:DNA-binding winged helix-turn-helix (wHTH) protein
VLTRDQLIDIARSSAHVAFDRSIYVQISRVRAKLEQDPKSAAIIRTMRNAGYVFLPEVNKSRPDHRARLHFDQEGRYGGSPQRMSTSTQCCTR